MMIGRLTKLKINQPINSLPLRKKSVSVMSETDLTNISCLKNLRIQSPVRSILTISVNFHSQLLMSYSTIRICGPTYRIQIHKFSSSIFMIAPSGYQSYMIQTTLKSIQES